MSKTKKIYQYGTIFNEFVSIMEETAEQIEKFDTKVLYGFKWNHGAGTYVRWLLSTFHGIDIDYIIDNSEISYLGAIYRRNLLDYLQREKTVIISATDDD